MASRRTTATFGAGLVLVAGMAALGACGDGSSDGELASDGGDAGSARDAGSSDASRTPSRDGETRGDGGTDRDDGGGGGSDGGMQGVLPPGPAVLSAAADSACALDTSGALRCWGAGRGTPAVVEPGSLFVDVAGGGLEGAYRGVALDRHPTCAIRSDGAVVCLRPLAGSADVLAPSGYTRVAVGTSVCAIATDGRIDCFGPSGARALGTDTNWSALAASESVSCALKRDGSLWCWGAAGYTGHATPHASTLPEAVLPGSTWREVSAGYLLSCAVRSDGALFCWGGLGFGNEPARVGTDSDWARVAVGYSFACAIKTTGTLHCFGTNTFGELGLGSQRQTLPARAEQVGTDTDWTSAALGMRFGCATKRDRSVRCWGSDGAGQLGRGTDHTRPAKVPGAYRDFTTRFDNVCAVSTGGSAACWGPANDLVRGEPTEAFFASPRAVGTGSGWASIALGREHGCLLASADGALHCWGDNGAGQVGSGDTARVHASPVATGITATAVGLGQRHSCAVHSNGGLYCWGSSAGTGQFSGSTTPARVGTDTWLRVAANDDDTCAVRADGTLWCLGDNGTVLTAHHTDKTFARVTAESAGHDGYYATASDETLATVESPTSRRYDLRGTFRSVAPAGAFFCGVRLDGTLVCGGTGYRGELGDGTLASRNALAPVDTATDWTAVAAGVTGACAMKADGSLYCWGDNTYGQMGDGTAFSATPVAVR